MNFLKRFFANRSGTTAIEYSLIGGFIALIIVTSVTLLGENVGDLFALVAAIF